MTTVLVTDADYKHTLGAIRNLAQHDVRVVAGCPMSAGRFVRGFLSRHTGATFRYPSPRASEPAFVDAIAAQVERHRVDVLLPIGDASVGAIARHRDRLPDSLAVPLAAWEGQVSVAADKRATVDLAESIGVPTPRVYDSPLDARDFPVVVKPRSGSGHVRYLHSPDDIGDFDPETHLCEEYVAGEGCAYFGLFEHGVERAFFMHRRVREYPPSGGPSTTAESIFDPQLRAHGRQMLEALRWHGVAMVEFKQDSAGVHKLMEINPKFWGSLDLAIASGVEFPWLATELALGRAPAEPPAYTVGTRFQWVFEDLVHAAARPASTGAVLHDLRARDVRHDVCRDDLKPLLAGAITMLRMLPAALLRR